MWFLISEALNYVYLEAIDPPTPTSVNNSVIKGLHKTFMLPIMPLLPMNWLYSHLGPGQATHITMLAVAVNSLFWGCFLTFAAKGLRKIAHR